MEHQTENNFLILPRIVFDLVDHCNLNCKGCGHLSPFSKPYFATVIHFRKDLMRVLDLGVRPQMIRLLGGEPLLHPEINNFLITARDIFNDPAIEVVTNGILLAGMPDEFWRVCKEKNIRIYVARYPIQVDYDEIINIAGRWSVAINVSEMTNYFNKVISSSKIYDQEKNFILCQSLNKCPYLREGKLFSCPGGYFIPRANDLFGLELPVNEDDAINIHDEGTDRNKIEQFLNTSKVICGWCHSPFDKRNIEWGISELDRNEWIE